MNVASEIESPDAPNLLTLTQAEAQARVEQLRGMLQKLDVQRSAIESEIRALGPSAHPEIAYGDHYTPRDYMPGWK